MNLAQSKERTYILYDGRAADGMGTSESSVLDVCDDEEEANECKGLYGDMACYSYRDDNGTLVDERFEWNWFPKERRKTHRRRR